MGAHFVGLVRSKRRLREPAGSKRFLLFIDDRRSKVLLHCAAGRLACKNTLANGFRRTLFLTEGTLKENSPDEPAKTGKSDSSPKPSQLSRRTFLGNIATVGIATTAAPLLQVGELDAQQVHQPTTDVAEAPTSAGTISVSLKINGQTKNLQIEPRVTLLDALRNATVPKVGGEIEHRLNGAPEWC
jgi:hypothetical protein